jgi:hypothetical protein
MLGISVLDIIIPLPVGLCAGIGGILLNTIGDTEYVRDMKAFNEHVRANNTPHLLRMLLFCIAGALILSYTILTWNILLTVALVFVYYQMQMAGVVLRDSFKIALPSGVRWRSRVGCIVLSLRAYAYYAGIFLIHCGFLYLTDPTIPW